MALGAFLAGVLLADSEYRHELESNIEPFKGLLLGLFFIAVGMSANLSVVLSHPLPVFGGMVLLVFVKAAVLYGLGRTGGIGSGASALAVALSQGGEFAFVIFGVAGVSGVLTGPTIEILIVIVTFSMACTPLLFLLRDAWAAREERKNERPFDQIPDEGSQVIIAGFGRCGQVVGRLLRLKGIPFTALDASAAHVDFVRRFGNKIYYGDASRVDLLRAARADHAKVFVLAIDDPDASMRTHTVQTHFPHLRIIGRARNRAHAYSLLGANVDIVIRDVFAASVDAARVTLAELGIPSSDARESVRRFAAYDEEQVRKVYALRNDDQALMRAAKDYTKELESLFEQDQRSQ